MGGSAKAVGLITRDRHTTCFVVPCQRAPRMPLSFADLIRVSLIKVYSTVYFKYTV